MADDQAERAALIERAQLIHQAQALHASNQGGDPSQPSAAAIGTPDGPTPAAEQKAIPLSKRMSNALAGLGQGGTAGYMPQITGGIQAGASKLGDLKDEALDAMGMGNLASQDYNLKKQGFKLPETSYVAERDAEAKRLNTAAQESPLLYHGAQALGAIGSGLALPAGEVANLSRAAKVAKAGAIGIGMGALQNPGDKEGEINPLQMGDRAKNAAIGGLTGGAVSGVGEYAPSALKSLAETQAFKSLGPYARAAVQAVKRGAKTPEEQALLDAVPGGGIGNVKSIGRAALDNDVIGWIPRGFKTIAARATDAKNAAGEKLEGLIGELGEAEKRLRAKYAPQAEAPGVGAEAVDATVDGAPAASKMVGSGAAQSPLLPKNAQGRPLLGETPREIVPRGTNLPKNPTELALQDEAAQGAPGMRDVGGSETAKPGMPNAAPGYDFKSGLDRQAIGQALRKQLISRAHADVPGVDKANDTIEGLIQHFEQGGDSHIPVMEAELKKRAAGTQTTFDKRPSEMTPADRFHNALYDKLKNGVEDTADLLDREVNGPSAQNFKAAKNSYGNLDAAEKISQKRLAHEIAKHALVPGIGAASGGALGFSEGGDLESRLEHAVLGATVGAGAGYALRQGRMYGPQFTARAADFLSKQAPKLQDVNPWALPALATNLPGGQNGK